MSACPHHPAGRLCPQCDPHSSAYQPPPRRWAQPANRPRTTVPPVDPWQQPIDVRQMAYTLTKWGIGLGIAVLVVPVVLVFGLVFLYVAWPWILGMLGLIGLIKYAAREFAKANREPWS